MDIFNLKFTLDGLNFVLKTLSELPNSSGSYPLWKEIEGQGIAEAERIKAAKSLPSDSQSTDTASSAKTD